MARSGYDSGYDYGVPYPGPKKTKSDQAAGECGIPGIVLRAWLSGYSPGFLELADDLEKQLAEWQKPVFKTGAIGRTATPPDRALVIIEASVAYER